MFRVNVMAASIGRSQSSLRKWEDAGKFPTPLFRSDIERNRTLNTDVDNPTDYYDRIYSRYQVELAHRIAKKLGMLKSKKTPDEFFTKLKERFYREANEM